MYHQTAVEYLGGCGYQSSLSQSPGRSSCLLSPHTLTLPSPPGTWGTDSPPLAVARGAKNALHSTSYAHELY